MSSTETFIPFHRPYVGEEEIEGVVDAVRSGWLTTGPRVKDFEARVAGYVGASHAVALNSCTAALHLALEAVGLKAGEEVITTTMTFAATAEVVRYFGARPVLVDVSPDTLNMDPERLAERITERRRAGAVVRAVIPVHFAGHPCDMDPIVASAREAGLSVIEDAAHTFPASYRGRSVGSIGDITCFSFYATKCITTGEGGMAVTENAAWAERMRIMSLHGISRDAWKRYTAEGTWYYEIEAPGFKYNMTDVAAAIGLAQLSRSTEMLRLRTRVAERYSDAFADSPEIETPVVRPDVTHSWHIYALRLRTERLSINRNDFIEALKAKGIGTSVHFIPLHIHPYYRDLYGYKPGDFPVAYGAYERSLSLPIYPGLTDAEIERVIDAVKETVRENAR